MRRAGRRVYTARGATQRKLAELTAYLQEVLGISGALLIKAFGRERDERARFQRTNDELRHLEIRASMIARRFSTLMSVLETTAPALIILAGGWLVINEGTSVGTVFVFATVLTQRFGMAAGSLGETQVNLVGSLALFRRIFTVLDFPNAVEDRPGARSLDEVEGAIELDAVTFAYPIQAAGAGGSQRPHRARAARRPRRPERRREDHAHDAHPSLLRPAGRTRGDRRPRHPRASRSSHCGATSDARPLIAVRSASAWRSSYADPDGAAKPPGARPAHGRGAGG